MLYKTILDAGRKSIKIPKLSKQLGVFEQETIVQPKLTPENEGTIRKIGKGKSTGVTYDFPAILDLLKTGDFESACTHLRAESHGHLNLYVKQGLSQIALRSGYIVPSDRLINYMAHSKFWIPILRTFIDENSMNDFDKREDAILMVFRGLPRDKKRAILEVLNREI
ncbi:MAG: hypothetical protein ABJH04_07390 [Cyclobacteriaceae bacterium]